MPELKTEQKPEEAAVANPKKPDYIADIMAGRRKRIPMSTATRKMEVAAIDGHFLYWAAEINLPAMLQAGYEFVDRTETQMVQVGLANDKSISGNTDLGTRVSMVGSLSGPNGTMERAYLMKLRQEWRDEDRAIMHEQGIAPIKAIFAGEQIYAGNTDSKTTRDKDSTEYVRTATAKNIPLFNRPIRKAKIGR
jgi:hypothetical protein